MTATSDLPDVRPVVVGGAGEVAPGPCASPAADREPLGTPGRAEAQIRSEGDLALVFVVGGTPVPQGSKGVARGRMFDSNASTLRPWRRDVTRAMLAAMRRERWATLTGPVSVRLDFYFVRPASVSKHRLWPHVKPDLDKCVRAVFDAITTAAVRKLTLDDVSVGAIHDDALVVELSARKRYAANGQAGVRITVRPALDVVSSSVSGAVGDHP